MENIFTCKCHYTGSIDIIFPLSGDEIKASNTTESSSMKAEYYKLKFILDSALHLQDFLGSTNMANS